MEAFESFVALTMEAEGLVVSEAVKFPVARVTADGRVQTHGAEVDLVGARGDKLVLATVKSFLGSTGVVAAHVMGDTSSGTSRARREAGLYALLNNRVIQEGVLTEACHRYGYPLEQVEVRLYAGHFAGERTGDHERRTREWCAAQHVGGGPIRVFGLKEVVGKARVLALDTMYRDNAALVAMKVLDAAHALRPVAETYDGMAL